MPTFKSKGTIVSSEIHFSQKHPHHIETSQLIRLANQLTGFYMIRVIAERHFFNRRYVKIKIDPKNQKLTCRVLWKQKFIQAKQNRSYSSIV